MMMERINKHMLMTSQELNEWFKQIKERDKELIKRYTSKSLNWANATAKKKDLIDQKPNGD